MPKSLRFRRFNGTQTQAFTGADAEFTVNSSRRSIHVHDGATPGGVEQARADMTNARLASASGQGIVSAATFAAIQSALTVTTDVAALQSDVSDLTDEDAANKTRLLAIEGKPSFAGITEVFFSDRRLLNTANGFEINEFVFDKFQDSTALLITLVIQMMFTTGSAPEVIRYDMSGGPADKIGLIPSPVADVPFTYVDKIFYPSLNAANRQLAVTVERFDGVDPRIIINPATSDLVAGTMPTGLQTHILVEEVGVF